MKYATFLLLLLTGCAATQNPTAAPVASYPSWLEMKEGYAESCIADGGCVPMSKREIAELLNVVHMKTLEMCRNQRTGW